MLARRGDGESWWQHFGTCLAKRDDESLGGDVVYALCDPCDLMLAQTPSGWCEGVEMLLGVLFRCRGRALVAASPARGLVLHAA